MSIKQTIVHIIKCSLDKLNIDTIEDNIVINIPSNKENGDYSSNIALILASKLHKNPIDIAQTIIENIEDNEVIDSIAIAKPGFINIFIKKDYLLKGHVINQRISNLEQRVDAKFLSYDMQLTRLNEKVDFFVRTSLPPVEGIFFDGQIFDAYAFATNLIKSAKNSLILIDNYIDENTLLMLSKRTTGVDATIYTQRITPQLQLDLTRHNNQYPPINIRTYRQAHDRFLIIDRSDVYHIGASLKDLGKKLFAFSKMDIPASILTKLL